MSTEDLDDRLHAAGEHWRAANATVANVDFGQLAIADEPIDVPVTPIPDVAPRPRRMRVLLAVGVGVAAAVAATIVAVSLGGSTPARHRATGTAASALIGVDWRLAQIAGPQGTPLAVSGPLMIDKNGKLTGTDGCNHLSAHVTIKADTINLGAVASTEVGCLHPGAAFGAQVALLDAVLSGTVHWSVQGDELTLSKDGIAALVYRAAPPPTTDPKALVGIDWQLTAVAQDSPNGTASSVPPGARIAFDGHGGFTESDGCNGAAGRVAIKAGTLVITKFTSTLVGCRAGDPAPEMVSKVLLAGTVTWSIKDGQLTLTKAGVGSLSYTSAANLATPTSGSS